MLSILKDFVYGCAAWAHGRRATDAADAVRPIVFEELEDRILLSSTMFLDFGAGIGMGNTLSATVEEVREIFGPGIDGVGTGPDLEGLGGLQDDDELDFAPALSFAQYDFNGDGQFTIADVIALADAIVPMIQRALEPFDIIIEVVAATSLDDMRDLVDATGTLDSYNIVMDITADTFGGGSVGTGTGLFGIAGADDLFAQAGLRQSEATLTFAENVFTSTTGVQGTDAFNQNLAQRLAYTATHEAFHTYTFVHTPDEAGENPPATAQERLLASGDVIRRGSVTREDPFIVTRFDLQHGAWANVAEPNNYLLTVQEIGLRDDNGTGRPDLAYVTGTGAHDEITLTDAGGGIVDVNVDAYSDPARTDLIRGESYTIDLATETDGEILVDASINNDHVIVDATIDADFRLRGGVGTDNSLGGVVGEANLLTLESGGLTGAYTPGAEEGSGTVVYSDGTTVVFSEFQDIQADNIPIDIIDLTLSAVEIDEGDTVTLNGEFVNIDTLDEHEIVIDWGVDWGDGPEQTVLTLAPGERQFQASFTYLDDIPSGIPIAEYTIGVTITDEDGDQGSDTIGITVNNVDPVITSFASDATFEEKAQEGEAVHIMADFTDVGILDTHTAVVDWGDGSAPQVVTVDQDAGFGTVQGSHAYDAGGIYTITLTLTDDDTGFDVAQTTAIVTGVGINDGTLFIVGTNGDDHVHVHQVGPHQVRVHADFVAEPHRTFALSEVDQIIAYLCEGDDHMTLAGNVTTPAIIHTGGGDNQVKTGGGPAVVVGGNGNNTLVGGTGRNILIAGEGNSRLVGGSNDDVLIGGTTDADDNDATLMDMLNAWNGADDYDDRVAAVDALFTFIDDGQADKLTGGGGRNLFYAGDGDIVTDAAPDEQILALVVVLGPLSLSEPQFDATATAVAPAPAEQETDDGNVMLLAAPGEGTSGGEEELAQTTGNASVHDHAQAPVRPNREVADASADGGVDLYEDEEAILRLL